MFLFSLLSVGTLMLPFQLPELNWPYFSKKIVVNNQTISDYFLEDEDGVTSLDCRDFEARRVEISGILNFPKSRSIFIRCEYIKFKPKQGNLDLAEDGLKKGKSIDNWSFNSGLVVGGDITLLTRNLSGNKISLISTRGKAGANFHEMPIQSYNEEASSGAVGHRGGNGRRARWNHRARNGGNGRSGFAGHDGKTGLLGTHGGHGRNGGQFLINALNIRGQLLVYSVGGDGGHGGNGGVGQKGGQGGRGGAGGKGGRAGYGHSAGRGGNGGNGGVGGNGGNGGTGGNGGNGGHGGNVIIGTQTSESKLEVTQILHGGKAGLEGRGGKGGAFGEAGLRGPKGCGGGSRHFASSGPCGNGGRNGAPGQAGIPGPDGKKGQRGSDGKLRTVIIKPQLPQDLPKEMF